MRSPKYSAWLLILAPLIHAQTAGPVYLDPRQPIEARIADLISQMTPEEKAAEEVVQLYVHGVDASVKRPVKEARGFQRIALSPKETRQAFYDAKTKRFVVEPGAFDIMVGSSSEDIRLNGKLQVK